MAGTSRGIHRLIGARMSRHIPPGAVCPVCRLRGLSGCALVYVVLSATSRSYACLEHGRQAQTLGYEVFLGEPLAPSPWQLFSK